MRYAQVLEYPRLTKLHDDTWNAPERMCLICVLRTGVQRDSDAPPVAWLETWASGRDPMPPRREAECRQRKCKRWHSASAFRGERQGALPAAALSAWVTHYVTSRKSCRTRTVAGRRASDRIANEARLITKNCNKE